MKHNIKLFTIAAVLFATASACKKNKFYDEDVIIDPNGASVNSVLNNATKAQINQLGVGVQSTIRNGVTSYYRESGSVGREIIYSASTDNRYFTEILGTQASQFNGTNDPAGIFNAYYNSYSSLRRRAEILMKSAQNSSSLSAQEKEATVGFCKSIQAYASIILLNMQGSGGIRETFSDLTSPGDLLKPGKFGTYTSGLVACKGMADQGLTALNNAGSVAFPFTMTSGWNGFSTVANFKKFNRAIAARIAMYQKDWNGMLGAVNASFFDLNESFQTGPVMTYSTAANDQTNGLFHAPNSNGAPYVIFDDFVINAEAGDTRVFGATAKVGLRTAARQSGAVSSAYEVRMYASNLSPISIIRNEELILMYAEAKINLGGAADLTDAVTALNKIRTTYGLANYAGAVTQVALIAELLKQRRYSLFFEGQRWFDALRYNIKASLPLQGAVGGNTFVVFDKMARPDAEVQWDIQNP
jgi:starch-binding outer membrane protein, SusD/RagB family